MDNLELDHNQQDDTYYHQYVRLYLANVALTSQVKDLVEQRNRLANRLHKYQQQDGCSSDRNHQRNKRFRRTAHQIQRFYKCIVGGCDKSYGSQGSLNQHYKLKHPQIYASLPNVQCGGKGTLNQSQLNDLQQQNDDNMAPKKTITTITNHKKKTEKQN